MTSDRKRLGIGRALGRKVATQRAHDAVASCIAAGQSPREADFAFHRAIALATNNRRFPEILDLIRPGIVPRAELEHPGSAAESYRPNSALVTEHAAISDAILDGDRGHAETCMEAHLEGSLARYRDLWREHVRSS